MPTLPTLPYTKGYISVNAVNAVRLGGFDPTQPYTALHRIHQGIIRLYLR